MKNQDTTLKNHGNQPKTMKNHETTLKNHGNQGGGGAGITEKCDVTDRGVQLTSFGPKNVTSLMGDPTDLLWCKNVTSLTWGPN